MQTTADFLDALRAKFDLHSDGEIGRFLGITHRQQMSWYRNLRGTFDEPLAMKIADLLEIDQAYVVACMLYQRAKSDAEKKLWERIATMTAGIAAGLAVLLLLPYYTLHWDGFNAAMVGMTAFDNNAFYASALYIIRTYAEYWWLLIPLTIIAFHFFPQGKRDDTAAP